MKMARVSPVLKASLATITYKGRYYQPAGADARKLASLRAHPVARADFFP
jgi:hypothetical protein